MRLRSRSIRATLGPLAFGLLLCPIRAEANGFHHHKVIYQSSGFVVPTLPTAGSMVAVTPNTLTLPASGMVGGFGLAPVSMQAASFHLVPVSVSAQPVSFHLPVSIAPQASQAANLQLPVSLAQPSQQAAGLSLGVSQPAQQTISLQLAASQPGPQRAGGQSPVARLASASRPRGPQLSASTAGQQAVNLQLPASSPGSNSGASGAAGLIASMQLPGDASGTAGGPPPSAIAAQFPLLAKRLGDDFLARLKTGLVNVVKSDRNGFHSSNPDAPKNIDRLQKLVGLLLAPTLSNDLNAGGQIADLVKSVVDEGLLGHRDPTTPAVRGGGDPTNVEIHIYIHVIDPNAPKGDAPANGATKLK